MGLDPRDPAIVRIVNRFVYLFVWEYGDVSGLGKKTSGPNKKITYLLQSAVDDVNSFLAALTQRLGAVMKLEYEDTKTLYERLMQVSLPASIFPLFPSHPQAIFAKVYTVIFPMYTEQNAVDDALVEAKRSELDQVTTRIIGVKSKYLMENNASDLTPEPAKAPPTLETPPSSSRIRSSSVRKGRKEPHFAVMSGKDVEESAEKSDTQSDDSTPPIPMATSTSDTADPPSDSSPTNGRLHTLFERVFSFLRWSATVPCPKSCKKIDCTGSFEESFIFSLQGSRGLR